MKKAMSAVLSALLLTLPIASCENADQPADDTAATPPETDNSTLDIIKLTHETPDVDPDAAIESKKYSAIADFCGKFLSAAADEAVDGENTLTSPLSAYFAMAMVKEGASGATLDELAAVLGDVKSEDIYALISHLSTIEETTLNIANSVWIDDEFEIRDEYPAALAKYYLAEGFSADLKHAEADVNAWISDRTNGLIENMLDGGALDSALLALVNTIYMNAKWQNEFDSQFTREMDFRNFDGTLTSTDFMYNGKAYESIIDNDAYVGVVLPYKDGSLKFVALMPKDESVRTAELTKQVASDGGWAAVADTAEREETRLYLPSFEHSYSITLNDVLKTMGIELAFSDFADLSGIGEELKLGVVFQNAVLKLDEAGTEAAAATVVVAYATAAMPITEPRILEFNRPFSFAVIDADSGAVLFAGEHNTAAVQK